MNLLDKKFLSLILRFLRELNSIVKRRLMEVGIFLQLTLYCRIKIKMIFQMLKIHFVLVKSTIWNMKSKIIWTHLTCSWQHLIKSYFYNSEFKFNFKGNENTNFSKEIDELLLKLKIHPDYHSILKNSIKELTN